MPDRYPSMDVTKANDECKSRKKLYKDSCPVCTQPVMLHCQECKIQVTGCYCTEIERHGSDEGIRRIIEREGEAVARAKLEKLGMWIPPKKR